MCTRLLWAFHIDLKGNLLADLRMWKSFLLPYKGWQPISLNEEHSRMAIEILGDASGNTFLGWDMFFPSKGLWMYQQLDKGWFEQYCPSIDVLELYALLARVVTWVPHLSDKTVIFRSDNTPTVHALLNKSSNSQQMLTLLRYFTLFCMIHKICIKALHIGGKKNVLCDLVSFLKLQEFEWVKPGHIAALPSQPATLILPISKFMWKSLSI